MENLIFCLNAVLPVFFMIFIGQVAIRRKVISHDFASTLNHLVYNWLIPALLFNSIYRADLLSLWDGKLIAYFSVSTIIIFAVVWIAAALFIRKQSMVGSFVQSSFRGNYLLIGLAIISGVFGNDELGKASMMAPILTALYNVLAVAVLTITSENHNGAGNFKKIASTLVSIITNPLIISIIIAIPFSLFEIAIPAIIYKPIEQIATMSTPVALIGIGAVLSYDKLKKTMKMSLLVAIIKTIIVPIIFIPIAVYLGFRGTELGILAVIFAAPSAVGTYSTARALGGDADLAANSLLLSTVMSVTTIVITFYLLKTLALI